MKIILLACAAALAGCGSYLADKSAKQACSGYALGTDAYAACYADAYTSERANLHAVGAAMSANGAAILTQPQTHATTCSWVGSVWVCN